MNSIQYITHQNLLQLLAGIAAGGAELYAPHKIGEKRFFTKVTDASTVCFDPLPTTESPKALLFPRVERLLSYQWVGGSVQVDDRMTDEVPQRVLFGARPCDAAGLKRLGDFFAAEIADAFVQQRRDHLTVVSMACNNADADCFCTSTGSGPADTTGSDVQLTPIGNERYLVEILTDRGRALFAGQEALLETGDPVDKERFVAVVDAARGIDELPRRLSAAFSHPFWKEASMRCLGCGACAYVCPTCSCFDIEDEGSASQGDRLRCWDSCGFSLFTLHTSGHNPRPTQSDRWRQRVMHKFSYIPDRYGFLGCVGCGRCSRACPVDMNLKEQVAMIASQTANRGGQ